MTLPGGFGRPYAIFTKCTSTWFTDSGCATYGSFPWAAGAGCAQSVLGCHLVGCSTYCTLSLVNWLAFYRFSWFLQSTVVSILQKAWRSRSIGGCLHVASCPDTWCAQPSWLRKNNVRRIGLSEPRAVHENTRKFEISWCLHTWLLRAIFLHWINDLLTTAPLWFLFRCYSCCSCSRRSTGQPLESADWHPAQPIRTLSWNARNHLFTLPLHST